MVKPQVGCLIRLIERELAASWNPHTDVTLADYTVRSKAVE